jgi:NAD(P)H-nitrite reductase large subunit
MSRTYDVVVVGAGAAGIAAASSARKTNADCSILVINGEDRIPYKRTRISKTLADGYQRDQFALHDEEWYSQNRIDRLDGTSLTAINRGEKTVSCSDGGEPIEYGALVLALGGEPLFPRVVRPHETGSFFVLRTAQDGEALRGRAHKAKTVLVAGMGVLAVEVANQLKSMGKRVTLAGATPQLIPRQLNARAGEILENVLASRQVKLLFQEEILSFERNKKKNWTVEMLKHTAHYDMVVFCIGVAPRVELARAAGLDGERGIRVDAQLRTSDPHIFAAGDCAEHSDGTVSQLWHEAEDQGTVAGANAAGDSRDVDRRPHRLKSEVFEQFVFSINKPREPWEFEVDEYEDGSTYYALYWNGDDTLHGAVMLNDADYAPQLETAVREAWDKRRVLEALELD